MFLCGRVYLKLEQRAVFFVQEVKRVEGLLDKRKEGQGPLGKTALSSPSSRPKQGRGARAPAASIPGGQELGAGPG